MSSCSHQHSRSLAVHTWLSVRSQPWFVARLLASATNSINATVLTIACIAPRCPKISKHPKFLRLRWLKWLQTVPKISSNSTISTWILKIFLPSENWTPCKIDTHYCTFPSVPAPTFTPCTCLHATTMMLWNRTESTVLINLKSWMP